MGCCNHPSNFSRKQRLRQNSEPINYEECIKILTEQKDATSFIRTICKAAGINVANGEDGETPEQTVQCVVVPVLSLCQEINIFDLDSELLEKMIKCTFASIFTRLDITLFQEVYSEYELFFKTEPTLDFATFSLLFQRQLHRLYAIYRTFDDDPLEFYKFLNSRDELSNLPECEDPSPNEYIPIIFYITKEKFLEELSEEFTKAEFATCQKFLRIELDLVIIMTRLVELATNTEGGISGVTEALNRVAQGEATRYFENDDFKDLFKAAESIGDVIEKLAQIYRKLLNSYKELSDVLICSRPQPPVKTQIREIPTIPPTVIL